MVGQPQCIYSAAAIAARVAELGAAVRERVGPEPVVVLGIQEGAQHFAVDLAAAIGEPAEVAWVTARSYGDAVVSPGRVRLGSLPEGVSGPRTVVVADTICDSGLTLSAVLPKVRGCALGAMISCVLFDKLECRTVDVAPDLVGFTVPDQFLVGYGLDYAGAYRDLPYVGSIARGSPGGAHV